MVDGTTRIKNLSIALEALSRFQTSGYPNPFERVQELLEKEISTFEKENQAHKPAPTPTEPSTDDIPF